MDILFDSDRVAWNFTFTSLRAWPSIYPSHPFDLKRFMFPKQQIEMQRPKHIKSPTSALFDLMNTPPDATEGVTELHRRAGEGELELVKSILAAGGNEQVNAKTTTHRFTPLHFAVAKGCSDIVTVLMDHQADIHACAGRNFTPLMCACELNNFVILRILARDRADLDKSITEKTGLLHLVARKGNNVIMNLLLNGGMYIDVTNEDNMTPLHIAIGLGYIQMAENLILSGAGVNNRFNACNRRLGGQYCDLTALHLAVAGGYLSIVELLFVKLADVNARTMDGVTPLHISSQKKFTNIFDILINQRANVDDCDEDGFTPLHFAATYNNSEEVRVLGNANINAEANKTSALQLAAMRGHWRAVNALVNSGAWVNHVNGYGHGMMHCAVMGCNENVMKRLLGSGADTHPHLPDTHKWTPLHHAGIVKLNALGVQLLIGTGASVELVTSKGWTPLHCAAYWNAQDLAYILLTRPNINLNAVGGNGCTPLHLAVRQKSEYVTKFLIDAGADVNVVDNMGWTCLHEAARQGYLLIALLLVHSNRLYTIDPVNDQGITPLHLAVKFNHFKIVQLLVNFGAEVNRTFEGGVTPLHLSARYCGVWMSKFLLRNFAYIDAEVDHGQRAKPITCSFLNTRNGVRNLFKTTTSVFKGLLPMKKHLERGGNPDLVGLLEKSLLSKTVARRSNKPFELLLTRKANMELANADGLLPIHLVAKNNRYNFCLRLLQSGSTFDSKAGERRMTPEQMAEEKDHWRITRLLKTVTRCFNYAKAGDSRCLYEIHKLKIRNNMEEFKAVVNATSSDTKMTLAMTAVAHNNISFSANLLKLVFD